MKRVKLPIGFFLALVLSVTSSVTYAGVGDGPRAYQVGPIGTNSINLMPIHQNSSFNVDGSPFEPAARITINMLAVQYSRLFEVSDRTLGVFAILPVGEVTGELINTSREAETSGIGDLVLGAVIGLTGAPAMTAKEFAQFKPGFGFGLLGKLTVPIGKYDSDDMFNLGANRWALQLGAVFSYHFGEGLLPGQVSSFELTPSVTLYGDNNDISSGDQLEQNPIYVLEANLTHDFNKYFWGSLDAVYTIIGSTVTDGVDAENDTEELGVGFTVGAYLPHGFSVQFNYGKTVMSDTDGYDDDLFRIKLSKSF